MASPFETCDTILTREQADHINERRVFITEHPRTTHFSQFVRENLGRAEWRCPTFRRRLERRTWALLLVHVRCLQNDWEGS